MTTPETDETVAEDVEAPKPKERMKLVAEVESKGACEKYVSVTISREDIDRYYSEAFSELMPKAEVPGFRPGRAPRKLVEHRFRNAVKDQVKANLLSDSIQQIIEEQSFSPISEPDVDIDAIELPDQGSMAFEFRLEVRPEFDVPQWKGLKINKPVREFTDEDVDQQIKTLLREHAQLTPFDGAASAGDFVVCNIVFHRIEEGGQPAGGPRGQEPISRLEEQTLQIKPVLSFRDANLKEFDKLMTGAKEGDRKTGVVELAANVGQAVAEQLGQGKQIQAQFEVLDVKQLELPEITAEFLESVGLSELNNEEDFREAVSKNLQLQAEYRQLQVVRQQIAAQLTASADWELPPDLLERQTEREFDRAVMELQSSGFSNTAIRAMANQLRQNSQQSTERALKEHFILEKLADELKVDAAPEEFDGEIEQLALKQNTSPRRLRARLEKKGQMDALRNQIVERKVLSQIIDQADVTEVPFEAEAEQTEAVDFAITGGDRAKIPEAKHAEPASLPQLADHT